MTASAVEVGQDQCRDISGRVPLMIFTERQLEDEYRQYKLRVVLQVDAVSAGIAIIGFTAAYFSLEAPSVWPTAALHLLPVMASLAIIYLSTRRRDLYMSHRNYFITGFRSLALLFPSFADTVERLPLVPGPLPALSLAALLFASTESTGFLALAIGCSLDFAPHLLLHALLLLRFLRQAPRVCAAPFLSQNPGALRQLATVARYMQSGLGALPEGVLRRQLDPAASCATVFMTVAIVVALVLSSFALLLVELLGRQTFLRAVGGRQQQQQLRLRLRSAARRELARFAQLDPLVLTLTFLALLPGVVSVVWHVTALAVELRAPAL